MPSVSGLVGTMCGDRGADDDVAKGKIGGGQESRRLLGTRANVPRAIVGGHGAQVIGEFY
jgi:hypothetical protein